MEIDRNNYESWFVDYLEGNLDEGVVDLFIGFLQENPDLKEELTLFESLSAVPENLTFASKNKLYKSKYDLEEEFNKTAIAEIEGDLDEKDKATFRKYLSAHPEKQKDRELFANTVLSADESIRFEKKNKLYKKTARKAILLWAGRVAAILILAVAIFSLIERTPESVVPEDQLAKTEDRIEPNKQSVNEDIMEPEIQAQTDTPEEKVKPATLKERNQVLPKKEKKNPGKQNSIESEEVELLAQRVPIEVPGTLNSITASVKIPELHAEMGVMTLVYPDYIPNDERLLADNLRGKISIQKITRAGLNLVANLSNERFSYETNAEGKVTEYNYDSRLLAFSIPAPHNANAE